MMKTSNYVVEMLNEGGLLDSRLVQIAEDGHDHGPDLAMVLTRMIAEVGSVEPGDTFRIREAV